MIKELMNRFSRWFNDLHGGRQVCYYLAFCAAFLLLFWLGIRFIRFDAKIYMIGAPQYIGKSSGPQFTDSLTLKKH